MAANPSSCFFGHEWVGLNSRSSNFRMHLPSRYLLPSSCRTCHRNLSSQLNRQIAKTVSSEYSERDEKSQPNADGADVENSVINVSSSSSHPIVTNGKADDRTSSNSLHPAGRWGTTPTVETKAMSLHEGITQQLSGVQLKDLVRVLKNVEKSILFLNDARERALQHLDNSIDEKETVQSKINSLEAKLAKIDAKVKVSTQEKIRVEFLEEQLVKIKKELYNRVSSEASQVTGNMSTDEVHLSLADTLENVREQLKSLRTENQSLKDDIESLKAEQKNIRTKDDQVMMLVKEKSRLVNALKDIELKFNESHADITKLSTLKFEYKNLRENVENLQPLLERAYKQADEAKIILQQNQDLHEKVGRLEESLEEATTYKLSAQKMLEYNELMHQKIKLLEERIERYDEEIQSHFQGYQESILKFGDALNGIKEDSNKRALNGPVNDMPWAFWSQLLLLIDGWLLDKKLLSNDAKVLRELVWKRDRQLYNVYLACKAKSENEALVNLLRLASNPTRSALHIVHIAAEMAPVAKVGGLGDVVTGLGKALQKKGHLIEIVLPKYDCMQYDCIHNLRALDAVVESYFDGEMFKNKIWVGTVEGIPVYFIEPFHPSKFFWRGQHYGEHDDFKRFSFFSRAALELLLQAGKKPDIIHCHDWQTAFVAPLYWDIYVPKGLNSARICFTCHNFEYQGTAPAPELSSCGLDVQQLNRPDRMQDNCSHHLINPVKGAIVFSNIVTTVSPTYEQEVRTPEGGRGLDQTLNSNSKKFMGILNGIDTDIWNPSTDNLLEEQYSSDDLFGKLKNKQVLRKKLGLSSVDVSLPLVGCITRLVPQKGIHLIRHAIYRTLELGGQFVLLGSSPVQHIQREFEAIASQFENHDHVRLLLKYDESLSHIIYAASDMFIIPSIFEPCGLTQMIAMRYGAIPIARRTGGLNDSVFDVDDDTIPLQYRNGFTFYTPDEQGLNSALDRAFHRYKSDRHGWEQLVPKVMNMDYSWDVSAAQYEELYEKSIARAAGRS